MNEKRKKELELENFCLNYPEKIKCEEILYTDAQIQDPKTMEHLENTRVKDFKKRKIEAHCKKKNKIKWDRKWDLGL